MPDAAPPLVSVIIPCYNYGHYLATALASVRTQDYPAVEVVVVDDGSTDDTAAVAARFPEVRYLRQANQGMSAARNAGVRASRGEYVVFLDADDWLLAGGLAANAALLQQHPQAAFVAGAYTLVHPDGRTETMTPPSSPAPYLDLLAKGNFFAMIAALMFARRALADTTFDPSLRECEDYDLYLRLARHHPVVQHSTPVAAYRQHTRSWSVAAPAMLAGALGVLHRERPHLRTPAERAAWQQGARFWPRYYTGQVYNTLISLPWGTSPQLAKFLLRHAPLLFGRYVLRRTFFPPSTQSHVKIHA